MRPLIRVLSFGLICGYLRDLFMNRIFEQFVIMNFAPLENQLKDTSSNSIFE